jgi:hypothetical protein
MTYINELPRHVGETVTLRGWIMTTRSSGKIAFLVLRDGSGYVQGVLSKREVPEDTWALFLTLAQESSVAVTGVVREDPRAPAGVELTVTALEVLGNSVDFPVSPKEHGTQFLFEQRHLWLRSRRQVAIARVRHEVVQSIRDFFYQRDFVLVDTPILTGAIGEEAGNLFPPTTSTWARPTWRRPGSSTSRPRRPRWGGCTASVPPSAPRSRRPGDTSPSSGWSSRKWRSMTRTTTCACRRVRELYRGPRAGALRRAAQGTRTRHGAAGAGEGALRAHQLIPMPSQR